MSKLTAEQIERLETFLKDSRVMSAVELGAKYRVSSSVKSYRAIVSAGLVVLRAVGLDCGRGRGGGVSAAELAEFREWKARQNGARAP